MTDKLNDNMQVNGNPTYEQILDLCQAQDLSALDRVSRWLIYAAKGRLAAAGIPKAAQERVDAIVDLCLDSL